MLLHHAPSLLTAARREILASQYKLLCDDARLSHPAALLRAVEACTDFSGIYLWSALPGKSADPEHTIYVGRTKSLKRRIADYLRSFQPHSANDYKLRIFQHHLSLERGEVRFRLYFKPTATSELSAHEAEAISKFGPVLNAQAIVADTEREAFQQAFERFYAAGFKQFLQPPPSDA